MGDPYPEEFATQKQARRDGCTCLWFNDEQIRAVAACEQHGEVDGDGRCDELDLGDGAGVV